MKAMALLAAALLLACGADEPLDVLTLTEPTGPAVLVREAAGSTDGGDDLFVPTRPTVVNGNVWVLDAANDHLVRFDSTLAHAVRVGREGEGPGELEFAQDFVVSGGRLIVAESGNSRFSVFDTTGAFLHTLPAAEAPRFVAVVGPHLLATGGGIAPYVARVDSSGRTSAHAAIPESLRRLAASDPRRYLAAEPYIAADPRGELTVLDQSVLALARFDLEGQLLDVRLLPEPFRTQLLERRLEQRAAWGARAAAFVDSPATKSISVGDDGRILIPFSLDDHWGLLVDPVAGTARPLPMPADTRLRDLLWAAADTRLVGNRLYIVSGSQLYQFAVEGW